jgi:transposase
MARYKEYDYSQGKFIPIHFDKQILPGTFEYSLHYLIDNEIDLSIFDLRYRNDEIGAPAYDPSILLKIILYAYSRGITSSRKIARSCEENIIFMALSADTRPHFTTIADFISTSGQEIIHLFLEVLKVIGVKSLSFTFRLLFLYRETDCNLVKNINSTPLISVLHSWEYLILK